MAEQPYQNLPAGRETDLLIAERVFGKSRQAIEDPYREDANPIPYYSTNDKDANELVEAVFEKFHPIWQQGPDGRYQVQNFAADTRQLLPGWKEEDGLLCSEAETLALAICRFVLVWFDRAGGGK